MVRVFVFILGVFVAFPGLAHDQPRVGPHGGPLQDIGDNHVELVFDRGRLSIYVTDAVDQPVEASFYEAKATVLGGGKKTAVVLNAKDGHLMVASDPLPAGAKKVVVSLKPSGGKWRKGLFTLNVK